MKTVNHGSKRKLAGLLRALLGRRNIGRFGRFLLNTANYCGDNDMLFNGELSTAKTIIKALGKEHRTTILDIGANKGDYTRNILVDPDILMHNVHIHCFEPCAGTRVLLENNLRSVSKKANISIHETALSSVDSTSELNVVDDGNGTNSLVRINDQKYKRTDIVKTQTIDSFARENCLKTIELVKIDTEGHDLSVLQGARAMLETQCIAAIQFEYNWRWIYGKTFLKDAIQLLNDFGYSIGRVTSDGIEKHKFWRPDLEDFVETNFIACLDFSSLNLHIFESWK